MKLNITITVFTCLALYFAIALAQLNSNLHGDQLLYYYVYPSTNFTEDGMLPLPSFVVSRFINYFKYKEIEDLKDSKENLITFIILLRDPPFKPKYYNTYKDRTLELVEFYIQLGVNVNGENELGCTPMNWALSLNDRKLIKLLNKHGAVPSTRCRIKYRA